MAPCCIQGIPFKPVHPSVNSITQVCFCLKNEKCLLNKAPVYVVKRNSIYMIANVLSLKQDYRQYSHYSKREQLSCTSSS